MEVLRLIRSAGSFRLGLGVVLLFAVWITAKWILNEQWSKAMLFRSYINFETERTSLALDPTIRPGTLLPGDSKVVGISDTAWAHLRNNKVQWMSGTQVTCHNEVIAVAGDRAKKLFRRIGYPDRMVSATNGADLVYFVGPNRESVLKIIAVENFWGELVLYRFTIGSASDPTLLVDTN